MASSFHCFFIVSMALVSQFLMGSSLASTPYIDKLCSQEFIDDKPFCLQTLSAYPSAVSANASVPLAEVVFRDIVKPQAKKAATFAAAQKDPIFKECHQAYVDLQDWLSRAIEELKSSSDLAIYDKTISKELPLAEAAILGIVQPQAKKAATFAAAQKDPIFKECNQAYVDLQNLLSDASYELTNSSGGSVYLTMICYDDTTRVRDLIGKKQDAASKTLMQMTIQMDKLLRIAVAAAEAVNG